MGKLEVQWSDMWQKDAREAKGEDIQNSGEASIAVWGRDTVNNWDEDASMDVWSHKER